MPLRIEKYIDGVPTTGLTKNSGDVDLQIILRASESSDGISLTVMGTYDMESDISLECSEIDQLIEALQEIKAESKKHHLAETRRSNRGQ